MFVFDCLLVHDLLHTFVSFYSCFCIIYKKKNCVIYNVKFMVELKNCFSWAFAFFHSGLRQE